VTNTSKQKQHLASYCQSEVTKNVRCKQYTTAQMFQVGIPILGLFSQSREILKNLAGIPNPSSKASFIKL